MTKEVIEGNKLIAEFMGLKFAADMTFYERDGDIKQVAYHSSWDWLMPVVEKINTIAVDNYGEMNVMIQADQCRIGEAWDDAVTMTTKANHPILITMVWTAVKTFIQWYNTQTKSQ